MNEDYIVTALYVMDEMLKLVAYEDDPRSQVSAAEILIVAVVAAKYFRNHVERVLCILTQQGETPGSVCRVSIADCTPCMTGCTGLVSVWVRCWRAVRCL